MYINPVVFFLKSEHYGNNTFQQSFMILFPRADFWEAVLLPN